MRVAVTGRVGGIYKKPSKNVMKLTKWQIKANKKKKQFEKSYVGRVFLTVILKDRTLILIESEYEERGSTSHTGGCFLLDFVKSRM